jgi:uncharacterized protein DUF4287
MDSAPQARLASMPQTPDEMLSAVSESLAARTGRSLEEWLALVRSSGVDPLDQAAVRGWLRREHGVPQNSQWAIADAAAREAGRRTGQATHKVSLRDVGGVDAEIMHLLRVAYEQNP